MSHRLFSYELRKEVRAAVENVAIERGLELSQAIIEDVTNQRLREIAKELAHRNPVGNANLESLVLKEFYKQNGR